MTGDNKAAPYPGSASWWAREDKRIKESDKHLGRDTHKLFTGKAECPECGSLNVLEQGYPHNHRHFCQVCDVVYWINRE